MTLPSSYETLIEVLPPVRGRYTSYAPIGETSWFRAGGHAEILYKPADRDDLVDFLKFCPREIPITVIGVCSNIIVRDGGIPGVVIRLGRGFTDIEQEDKDTLYAGSAALDLNVALQAQKFGIGDLEFFSGIPGTVGGALRMNAGAYGTETSEVLVKAEAVNREGQIITLKPGDSDMVMRYRFNSAPSDLIFLGGYFKGSVEASNIVEGRISEIKQRRAASQPIRARTGGSTFANPFPEELQEAGLDPETRSWQLIDQVGGRGFQLGGAQMSEKHCNFMINTGNATAEDLENLGEEMRKRVLEKFGITLRWEIKRLGEKSKSGPNLETDVMGVC